MGIASKFSPHQGLLRGVGGDGSAKVSNKDKRPNELAKKIWGKRGRDVFDQWNNCVRGNIEHTITL